MPRPGLFRPMPLADGRLIVLSYTGRGLRAGDHRAAADRGRERDHVPRRRTGGASTRWSRPGRCRRRARVDEREADHAARPVRAARARRAAQRLSRCCRATRTPPASATASTSSDPIGFAQLGITAAYTPDAAACRAASAATSTSTGRYLGWRGELAWNKLRLLRPVRADQAQPQGLRRQARLRPAADLRRAAQARAAATTSPTTQIDTLPGAQNVGTPFTRLLDRRGRPALHRRAPLARRGRRREGRHRGRGADRAPRQRPHRGAAARPARCRLRAAARRMPRSGRAARSVRPAASATTRSSNFYFGGFGNNRVDNGAVKRYRDYDAMPGFGLNEISGLGFARQMFELNLPPLGVRVGRHAEPVPELAAAGAVRHRAVDRPGQRGAAQDLLESRHAGRPALLACCTGTR